jgi:hypothetical protein
MEAKISIVEILKDKPKGIRLYSPIFGECAFLYIQNTTDDICVKKHNNEKAFFNSEGLYNTLGECLLFPSKKMRDWEKFSWKKGDILVSNDNDSHIIFKGFSKNDYTTFEGKYWISVSKKRYVSCLNTQNTQDYHIEDDKDAAQTYINTIEKRLGGKLNLETLEIEKQPEFKDGDIVTMHKENCDIVSIFSRLKTEVSFYYYAFHAIQTNNTGVMDCYTTLPRAWTFFEGKMNFATDSEKQELFSALAKKGKAWDAEKKEVVDLKPKIELKPFDKVLVRDGKNEIWEPAFFFRNLSHLNVYNYQTVGGESRVYCIPFNEETAKLIGTTDDWEG